MALNALLLAGCSDLSPQQTTVSYQPADGINLSLGSTFSVSNLLVVSAAKGKPGVLSGQLVNTGTTATTVSIAGGGSGATVVTKVPAGGTVDLSGVKGDNRQLPSINQVPGSMLAIQIGTPQSGPLSESIPVLPPTLYYSSLSPTSVPSPTSASPTSSASPTTSTAKPSPTSAKSSTASKKSSPTRKPTKKPTSKPTKPTKKTTK